MSGHRHACSIVSVHPGEDEVAADSADPTLLSDPPPSAPSFDATTGPHAMATDAITTTRAQPFQDISIPAISALPSPSRLRGAESLAKPANLPGT